MKTPITDGAWRQTNIMTWSSTAREMRNLARKLELDRAALMGALANLERRATFGTVTREYLAEARTALSAARANFPDED